MPADFPYGNLLPQLYIALPVMDEPDSLPVFLDCLESQSYNNYQLVVCVNQPDHWWHIPEKLPVCRNNALCLKFLNEWQNSRCVIIDHSSDGKGWKGKKHGVGYARKTVMDYISHIAKPEDIIVSLDADTTFSADYLKSLAENFTKNPDYVAVAIPYYHHLTGDENADRAILRYEIYMRHYFLNLAIIGSPYTFSALGSAMAVPVWAYRAVKGMAPRFSGEDFYFLQKLRKFGKIGLWNEETVYPAARFSDRVFFGTGPAMIKGATGDWSSYPVYPQSLFEEIHGIYGQIDQLFHHPKPSRILRFLAEVFNENDPLQPLRENHPNPAKFARAFHEKFDGLRILQFLKTHHQQSDQGDTDNLADFMEKYFPLEIEYFTELKARKLSFLDSPLVEISEIRDFLYRKEMRFRSTGVLS